MAVLKTYQTFEQKADFLSLTRIRNKSDFDSFYNKLSNSSVSLWRGSNESKHKIYTSLQRYWIENDFVNDLDEILKYIGKLYEFSLSWNKQFLIRYYNNYGVTFLPLFACLSILRHHGAPTPLLDWSRNPKIALFFAAHYVKNVPSDQEIENFFSLFELSETHPYSSFNIKASGFADLKAEEITKEMIFSDIKIKGKTIFKIEDLQTDSLRFYINNNYNITNQEGLFIFNITPKSSLEEAILIREDENGKYYNLSSDAVLKQKEILRNSFKCFEIHKSLKEYCLANLKQDGIDENYIFPNLQEFASHALKNYLVK